MSKRKLVLSRSFEKAYKKFIAKNHGLKGIIEKALIKLKADAFAPGLKTHKLSGNIFGYYI